MTLATALREHESAVRADFQQFYGLNIDGMGRDFSTTHAADLLVELPGESRIKRTYGGDGTWDFDRLLASLTVDALNLIVWQRTKDGQKGRNRPKPITPQPKAGGRNIGGASMSIEELNEILSRSRGVIEDG